MFDVNDRPDDEITVLFFGYTHCPDVCQNHERRDLDEEYGVDHAGTVYVWGPNDRSLIYTDGTTPAAVRRRPHRTHHSRVRAGTDRARRGCDRGRAHTEITSDRMDLRASTPRSVPSDEHP